MSSFTFILHVPDRFYWFCKLRILHKSRPQIKATLDWKPHQKVEKLHISRGFCTILYGIHSSQVCSWVFSRGIPRVLVSPHEFLYEYWKLLMGTLCEECCSCWQLSMGVLWREEKSWHHASESKRKKISGHERVPLTLFCVLPRVEFQPVLLLAYFSRKRRHWY